MPEQTAEQAQMRTMFYADLREAMEACAEMAKKAVDVEGIIKDCTHAVLAGGAEASRLDSLVKPLRLARGQLQRVGKLCREYETELERREADAERAREEAMEPLSEEELDEGETEEAPDESS